MGAAYVGPAQLGYESGDTDAMLNPLIGTRIGTWWIG